MPATVLAYSGGLASSVALWELARQSQAVHCLYVDQGQLAALREWEQCQHLVSRLPRRQGPEITLHKLTLSMPLLVRNSEFLLVAIATAAAEVFQAQTVTLASPMSLLLDDLCPHLSNITARITSGGRFSLAGLALDLPNIARPRGEIVAQGHKLNVPLRECWSCHRAGRLHCGRCGGCKTRRFAFVNAALSDPTLYQQDLTPAA